MSHIYRFRSQWRLDAPPTAVYAALRDVAEYPRWWPQVRSARQLDDQSGEISCRSFLPYTLRFVATRDVEDPVALRLRARLRGDLNGFSEWIVESRSRVATTATFVEEVTLGSPTLRRVSAVTRPVMVANHSAMMRAGERGLRALLLPA
ncbi:polyketide cyclase/dehydrase/lipid transport protein [Jatrophihabitans sp. GAS493]|uniref:SRPBCC family protein n=1 Tax=Jatrophihabitans sp. GAS493 TaxID=1907575 RepID=UPI000BC05B42|nr:SRPBCC family protein [Jatrophihabitans sp. GAS493]SOD73321.1 polyketide cyclase/dehydrase/lipid transport protein [Jatrophihabitans sp. GAS493]